MGETAFGVAMVWVHPYQACVSTLDEAAKKLALLTTSSKNWAYAFVQFNEDAQHVPLPKEGHLSGMTEEASSRIACRHLCQLEVCLLLQVGCQVVYLEGLNGGLEPVVTSLPESLTHGVNMLNDPTFLPVDLSQFMAGNCALEASAPHQTLTQSSPTHLIMEHPPRAESHIRMTAEVQELLLHAVLDTSSQAYGSSTPKRPTSTALGASSSSRVEDSSKLVATSSQATHYLPRWPWPEHFKTNHSTKHSYFTVLTFYNKHTFKNVKQPFMFTSMCHMKQGNSANGIYVQR